jgi:spore coat protein U-like protein
MLKRSIVSVIGLAALMSTAALATGSSSGTLAVTASITSSCDVTSSTLPFGVYDPLAGAVMKITGSMQVACTTDITSASVELDHGTYGTGTTAPTRKMSDGTSSPGPHYLTYNIYTDGEYGTVWGSANGPTITPASGVATNVSVYGQIDGSQQAAPAGSYTDTVQVTVTF